MAHYLQAFRIFVELILWRGYRLGVLPVQMTFEGRNFDILVGLSAPLMGWLWTRTHKRYVALAWNFIGLVLLLNIVLVAVLSLPTGSHVFSSGPAATLLTRFPFIYLPATGGACAGRLHGSCSFAEAVVSRQRRLGAGSPERCAGFHVFALRQNFDALFRHVTYTYI